MEVHHILIILLSAKDGVQAENLIKSGKVTEPLSNVHQDIGVYQLMAQQIEFEKIMMKQMSKFSKKEKEKEKKRKGSQHHSNLDSSDSD